MKAVEMQQLQHVCECVFNPLSHHNRQFRPFVLCPLDVVMEFLGETGCEMLRRSFLVPCLKDFPTHRTTIPTENEGRNNVETFYDLNAACV